MASGSSGCFAAWRRLVLKWWRQTRVSLSAYFEMDGGGGFIVSRAHAGASRRFRGRRRILARRAIVRRPNPASTEAEVPRPYPAWIPARLRPIVPGFDRGQQRCAGGGPKAPRRGGLRRRAIGIPREWAVAWTCGDSGKDWR